MRLLSGAGDIYGQFAIPANITPKLELEAVLPIAGGKTCHWQDKNILFQAPGYSLTTLKNSLAPAVKPWLRR